MLRSLGGGQIKKKTHKNNGGQSQSFKNNNNKSEFRGSIRNVKTSPEPEILKKMCENLIFEQKWPNFGPKKGPKMAPIFLSKQKLSLTIFKQ